MPFHISAIGTAGWPCALPTATQELAEAHDTATRKLFRGGGTLGVRWTDQEVPFHRSASADPLEPTSVQAVGEVHDTPLN